METTNWISLSKAAEISGYSKCSLRRWFKLGVLNSRSVSRTGERIEVDYDRLQLIMLIKGQKQKKK